MSAAGSYTRRYQWGPLIALALLGPLTLASGADPVVVAETVPVWSPVIANIVPYAGPSAAPSSDQDIFTITLWATRPVPCSAPPQRFDRVLWVARDNDPLDYYHSISIAPILDPTSTDDVSLSSVDDAEIPTFTDPVRVPAPSASSYHFLAGESFWRSNVWDVGDDIRTDLPEAVQPTGYAQVAPFAPIVFLPLIQSVWPHDGSGAFAPVDVATEVDVAVDVFQKDTTLSVPADFPGGSASSTESVPDLLAAEDHLGLSQARYQSADRSTYEVDGQEYPRWTFSNIPVEPGHVYHFLSWLRTSNPMWFSNIWTHAAEAQPEIPPPPTPAGCTPS